MAVAALITWLLTAVGGFVMLGKWIAGGGHRPGGTSRLAPGLVFGHFALAAIGLVLWIVYLVAGGDVLAWTAFVVLLPVALLGFTMLARWIPSVRGSDGGTDASFPIPVVVGHGLLAATTLVLVLLTAAGVGVS
ncbi:hypothetical protein ABNF97_02700 [Plantactinospora sp. B6F1]|uniref:hypothetical protein n=1 Tax=Plantactinospora sp. B6F1 TaxID=3158971 RepID=UPI0032D8C38C